MLENIRGHSRGSIPPLRMPSPLPHDLCHEWNVSRRLPANIDSKYAFRVAHDFGTLGKQHHFLISSENNIKSRPYACIQELLDAISTVTA